MLRKRIHRPLSFALTMCICTGMSNGCASITSTWYGDDGCQTCEKATKHLKGVPTTLDVPTHLHVYVVMTRYGTVSTETNKGAVNFVPELETKSVGVEPVVQKEIFTVDFKRPASGSLAYDLKFDVNKQYITKIDNSLDDRTIASVAALISQVLKTVPTIAGGRSTSDQVATGTDLIPFQEVIASEMFALNEPNVQERIQAFLDTYINHCDRQCGPCPYPGPPPACLPVLRDCNIMR
jgi:hypothetical protein